jgi:hypothetical protein
VRNRILADKLRKVFFSKEIKTKLHLPAHVSVPAKVPTHCARQKKRTFATRALAAGYAVGGPAHWRVKPYRCPDCGLWHLTTKDFRESK